MSGPQTEAGRKLVREWGPTDDTEYPQVGSPVDFLADFVGMVLAIEREAVAAFLASPEVAEGLTRALLNVAWVGTSSDDEAEPAHELAVAALIWWQQERESQPEGDR